jgi:ferrous iron transport protein B
VSAPPARKIRVAIAGNPNSGKTSLFNLLTGMHQHVGNWPGVTVERKTGQLEHAGYLIEVVDLPGTYALTAYSLEERIARDFILEERPDVVVNVVDTANLARHLLLTVQLLETGVDVVVALNMWDEFQRTGARLEEARLEALLGVPVVATVGHRGQGRAPLLGAILALAEERHARHRHVPVSYGPLFEPQVQELSARLATLTRAPLDLPPRYLAVKLLEGDDALAALLFNRLPEARPLLGEVADRRERIRRDAGREPALLAREGRSGFITGLLHEVLRAPVAVPAVDRMALSRRLDGILTHRWLGLPIFALFMWLLFNLTFTLGAAPKAGLAWLVARVGDALSIALPAGWPRALLVDGILAGVGAVIVYLPNILLLFLGIAVLEATGYMARAAFLMDRLMHLLGLHGQSFIPMLMGFGCSVPAVMATRSLHNPRDRILTALLIPHMSCSARLPVYILFAGAFFPHHAGTVVALIYLFGIVVAVALGKLFSSTLFRRERTAFVMELPPYRWPTVRGLFLHAWQRTRLYLRKMGGVILIASVVLWALSVFPGPPVDAARPAIEYSVMGRLGHWMAPLLAPLGFPWQLGVTLLSGFVAKEVVVSSLAVLYQTGGAHPGLAGLLAGGATGLAPLGALAFMVFVLLYTPCVMTVLAIRREFGARWMWFEVGYQLALAWISAFAVYRGGRWLGLG